MSDVSNMLQIFFFDLIRKQKRPAAARQMVVNLSTMKIVYLHELRFQDLMRNGDDFLFKSC